MDQTNHKDLGLFILRLGIGVSFMVHGWGKLKGGEATWIKLGGAMSNLGITFFPTFWGLMASCAEFFGGLCLILGLFFQPATILMFITMLVASILHIKQGDGFSRASHAIESAVLFISLFLIGPGSMNVRSFFKK